MKELKLFDFVDQVSKKKQKFPYDKKIAPAYMISMFLSHNNELIELVNKINKYQFMLPDEIIYQFYIYEVPKKKRYIKWIKKKKEKDMEEEIKKFKNKYPRLSMREAKMYITYKRRMK